MTEILPLKAEDRAAARIEADSLSEAWSESAILALCERDDAAVFAAYEVTFDGGVEKRLPVGLAHCGFVLDEAHVNNVSVLSGYRRRGIGEALMQALVSAARERGCTVIFLDVRCSNAPAVSLYKKLGFSVLGERAGADQIKGGDRITGRENALVMGKKLM